MRFIIHPEGHNMPDRNEILRALDAYELGIKEGKSERQVDDMMELVIDMVPHARFTDLYFWGERERTKEEIVDEALFRESLWREGGELAVLVHVHDQMRRVVDDPAANDLDRDCATQGMRSISARLEELKGGKTQ